MSRVDVIVPCYNYARYLRDCVASALNQPGVDVRVLVIDDCSPDDTPAVGRQLAADDSRVEFRRHEQNKGHIETYNEGIEWASGDYVLLLSADDMVTPGAFARATRLMNEHPEVTFAYGPDIKTSEPRFDAVADVKEYRSKVVSGPEFWRMCGEAARNFVPTPSAMVRTTAQKRVGGYRKHLPHSGDLEMWLRLSAIGSVGIINVPQGFYRTHGSQMSTGFRDLRDLKQRKQALDDAAKEWGHAVPNGPAMLAAADPSIADVAFWTGSRAFEAGDDKNCDECLAFAVSVWPGIKNTKSWRRLTLKRKFGAGVWRALRPAMDWARGRKPSSRVAL